MPNKNDIKLSDKTGEKKSVSLSPLGYTLPIAERRLKEIAPDKQGKDAEHIMMKLWEETNTRSYWWNMGLVPLDTILHVCNEKCGSASVKMQGGSHYYTGTPNEHDIRVAAATVQWLATNVGRDLLNKFSKILKAAHEK